MMTAKFNTREEWYKAIAAAVMAGLTFEAWEYGMAGNCYVIEYTGGY